jgi:hypothetical protein
VKLLFCPHCGAPGGSGSDGEVRFHVRQGAMFAHYVACTRCGCRSDYYRTPDMAQARWNARERKACKKARRDLT